MAEAGGFPVVSFLEIDGRVLSGEEFEEYCKDHGLCKRCAKVRTHRRVIKLFGKGKKWEPMTLHDQHTGEYRVYKGYCLQSTCYTLGQAKRMTGESGGKARREKRREKLKNRFKTKSGRNRPSMRRAKTNPETGSVMSAMDDDMSIMSGMSDISGISGVSRNSSMSSFSGFSFRKKKSRRSSNISMSDQSISTFGSYSDDETIDTTQTPIPQQPLVAGVVSPIIESRLEQIVQHDYLVILDLTKLEVRQEDVDAIAAVLEKNFTLESIILNKCKLRDDGMVKICEALERGNHVNLKSFSCRQNRIGNKGVLALSFLLKSSPTLETLDLSENSISSKGAASILSALNANPASVLTSLNLSQNEIWDMGDGSFLRNTTTLRVFNLDGNFMHDEGAEQIALAIAKNRSCKIEKLQLGWNGIGDDGAAALAKMMEANNTLQVLGLAENDISNTGARAILSALAINTSVREISGLYHNQIDRKFIIVAIKRLLHRYGERTGQNVPVDDVDHHTSSKGDIAALDNDPSESSNNSVNWASQMYSDERHFDEKEADPDEGPSIALEAIEHWDWGTFGIEELEASGGYQPVLDVPVVETPKVEPPKPDLVEPAAPLEDLPVDRLTIFQSAPLAFFNRDTSEHHAVPIFDFDYEVQALKGALSNKRALGGDIELNVENVTAGRFKVSFLQGTSRIMHFSGHGQADCVALENGFGYMQALPTSDLKRFVQNGAGKVDVVVLSSCHARSMGESFLEAGVPHVVCCQRDSVFRDEGPIEFSRVFYQALASRKTLKEAFEFGLDAVKRSPLVKLSGNMAQKYCLLPEKTNDDPYHKIQVFYQQAIPKIKPSPEISNPPLPELPEQFVGREVDMYEVLESLRVDDVVRVGGAPGCGKASVISAVSRYILDRSKSFKIDNVYWLPPPKNALKVIDPIYQDLCRLTDLTIESEDCIWDDEDFATHRDRLTAALQEKRTILVIDGRQFTSEASGENLEKLLTHLLNEASMKIVLLTAVEASRSSKTKSSRSEETMVNIGPLDLRSSALLFGNSCKHLSDTHFHTAEEFADYLVPPWMVTNVLDEKRKHSRRHQEIYERLGKGNPKAIAEVASTFTEKDLSDLLRFAKRPEIQVESAASLETEISKWTALKNTAMRGKNFARAKDLTETLEELESLRSSYLKVDDLASKEAEYKEKFKEYLKAKEYNKANAMKRKILEMKKLQLKEKNAKPAESSGEAKETKKASSLDEVMTMTEKLNLGKSIGQLDTSKTLQDHADSATLKIICEEDTCNLSISVGSVVDISYSEGLCGVVYWSNETCDLKMDDTGSRILRAGGNLLQEELDDLEAKETTEWGPVKCSTGDAIMLGPLSFMGMPARFLLLAVGPFDQDWDGEEWNNADTLHFLDTELRSSYRSIFQKIGKTGIKAVGIQALTTKEGSLQERTLWVGLKTLIEEAKISNLGSIYLYASSKEEANLLIKMALDLGLSC